MYNFIRKTIPFVIIVVVYYLFYIFFPKFSILPSALDLINVFRLDFMSGEIFTDIFASLKRVSIGFLLATFFAVPFGLLFSQNKLGNHFLVIANFLKHIPPIAWIPLAIILLGLGDRSAYFIVFMGSFFPIFLNTFWGAKNIPKKYKEISKTFQIPKLAYIYHILYKYSLPYIFSGLKVGIGMAWMSVIASELIGAQSGLGYYIQLNRLLLRMDKIVFGIILIGIIGLILNSFISYIQRKTIVWEHNK